MRVLVSSLVSSGLVGLMRLVAGVQPRWIGVEPQGGQRIYVANHTSHIDGLAVWAALPPPERRRARPVAARDYWQSSWIRRVLARDVFRVVFVGRGEGTARDALENLTAALDAGDSLILFPEGTRGDGETLGRFQAGVYHLAADRPEIDVVPVYLANLGRVLPKGKVVPIPVLGRATFGAPLRPGPDEDRDAFLARLRDAVLALRDTA